MPFEFIVPAAVLVWFVIWALRRTKEYEDEPSELAKALPRILKTADPFRGPVIMAGRAEKAKRLFL
jgi:hypothetical protein